MTLLPAMSAKSLERATSTSIAPETQEILCQKMFRRMIAVERKRTERSKEPFLLLLLEAGHHQQLEMKAGVLDNVASSLGSSIRETDVIGWYSDQATVGVLYTGLQMQDKNLIVSIILNRVSATLRNKMLSDQFSSLTISFYFFPDDWDRYDSGRPTSSALYPDLLCPEEGKESVVLMKRAMDVVGSALLLILCSPLFVIIAFAVKCSSKGPVLFRQRRVGQFGERFTFLKFRSMLSDNDHSAHKEYVTKFIADEVEHQPVNANGDCIYKLTRDKRVTRVGKFLRRTSLDELPQLLNVLKGDMSLVGPRPPIPYEMAVYQAWHRRRVLKVKPGITGLWQVTGRSRVKFDEMVRLDLRYATSWTPWLDLKIILRTPLAVIRGAGAV